MHTPDPFPFVAILGSRPSQLGIADSTSPLETARLAAELIRYHRRYVRAAILRCNGDDAAAARLGRLLDLAGGHMHERMTLLRLQVVEYFSDPRAGGMLTLRALDNGPPILSPYRDADGRPHIIVPL